MADLTTVITVDVTGAGEVSDLAGELERADAAADKLKESLAGLGAGSLGSLGDLGFGAIGTQAEAAATKVGDSVRAIQDELKSLGDLGAGAFAGLDSSAAAVGDELKGVADAAGLADKGVASLGDTVKVTADANDALKTSAAGSAEGLKAQADAAGLARDATVGLGDATKAQAEQMAAMNKLVADQNRLMSESSAVMADTTALSARAAISHDSATAIMEQTAATSDLTAGQVAAEAQARNLQKANEASAAAAAESGAKWHMAALGGAAALGYGTYLAAQLQSAGTRWYTSAGESLKNLPGDESALLAMSGPTATSQAALEQGEYWAQSAGFHGKDAAPVLKEGAEGAYSEGANLGDTENALTTVLNDYYGGPQASAAKQQTQAVSAMNAIMASVGAGKMTLQGLAGALPTLLPAAKQAQLSLPQVLGAESTMTAQGTSAGEAAQLIKHTIGAIQGPSSVQAAEMQMLGINPVQLEKDLGKQGLTGTVAEADAAIQKHTKDGMVHLDTMNHSVLAMQSANAEIAQLPKNLQGAAKEYLAGTMGNQEWYKLTGQSKSTLSTSDLNLLDQFKTDANLAHGFSAIVKSGMGTEQTPAQALNKLFGGQEGQQVALGVGGSHLKTFSENVATIGVKAATAGSNIAGWSKVQDTLNYKLKDTEYSLEAVATQAGQALLPAVTKVLGAGSDILGFAASHQTLTQDTLLGAGALAIPMMLSKVLSPLQTLGASLGRIGSTLGIPGAEKLAGIGQGSSGSLAGTTEAASGLTRVGGAADAAAGALQGIVGASGKAVAGEEAAGAAGERESVGETAAGGAGVKEAIGEEAGGVAGAGLGAGAGKGLTGFLGALSSAEVTIPVALALFIKGLGDQLSPKGTAAGQDNQALQHEAAVDPTSGAITNITGGFESWLGLKALGESVKPALSTQAVSPYDSRFGPVATVTTPPPGPSAAQLNAAAHQLIAQQSALFTPAQALQSNADLIAQRSPGLPAPPPNAAAAAAKALPAPAGWATPDLSGLDAAKTKAMADMSAVDAAVSKPVHPAAIPAPDMSALNTAKTKVSADMTGITAAMKSEAGPAGAAGGAVASGFASGISSGSGPVAAAAASLGETAMAALRASIQSRSPSKLTMVEGDNYVTGFVVGAEAALPKVAAVAAEIAAAANAPLKSTAKIGSDTVATLTANLQGGQAAITAAQDLAAGITAPFKDSTIASALTTMDADVAAALKKHTINAAEASGLDNWLAADNNRLQKLAGQRSQLETQIQQASAYGQNITASANQGANIVTIAQNAQAADQSTSAPPPAEPVQASDLIAGMQQQVQQTKQFTSDLAKLKKMGLNKAEIDQIQQAGAAAGDPVAEAVINGGKSAVSELNKLSAEMNKAAGQLGKQAESDVYDPSKDKAQLKAVDAQMASIAKSEVAALSAALSGGAAAAAFSDVGTKIASEIAAGVSGSASAVVSALVSAIEAAEEVVAGGGKSGKGGKGSSGGKSGSTSARPDAASHPAAAAGGKARTDKASLPGGSFGGGSGGDFGVGPGSFGVNGPGSFGVQHAPHAPHPAMAAGGGGGSTAAGYWTGSGGGSPGGDTHIHMNIAGSVVTQNEVSRAARTWNLNNASNNWQGGNRFPGRGI